MATYPIGLPPVPLPHPLSNLPPTRYIVSHNTNNFGQMSFSSPSPNFPIDTENMHSGVVKSRMVLRLSWLQLKVNNNKTRWSNFVWQDTKCVFTEAIGQRLGILLSKTKDSCACSFWTQLALRSASEAFLLDPTSIEAFNLQPVPFIEWKLKELHK